MTDLRAGALGVYHCGPISKSELEVDQRCPLRVLQCHALHLGLFNISMWGMRSSMAMYHCDDERDGTDGQAIKLLDRGRT